MVSLISSLDPQGLWLAMQNDDADFCKALGQRIAHLRKEKGLTQVQFAPQLGLSQQALSHYENGRLRVPLGLLPRLADIFDMTLDELLTGQAPSQRPGKRGPVSRLQQQLTAVSSLPKTKQKFVSDMLDTVLAQHGLMPPDAGAMEHHTG